MVRPTVGLPTARALQWQARDSNSGNAELHGDCSSPYVVEMIGQQSILFHRLDRWNVDTDVDYAPEWGWTAGFRGSPRIATAYVSVRCRRCRECLRARAKLWTARAVDEIAASERTWFVTLTLSPDAQFHYRCVADRAAQVGGSRWHSLSADEQFKDRVKAINPELTRFIKRVRKNSGASLRYLLVSEAHKSGDPHFHMLLHEHGGTATKRVIEQAWRLGFSKPKLVDNDPKAAVYVCKYLTKSVLARLRSSARYGTAGPRLATERLLGSDALRRLAGEPDHPQRKEKTPVKRENIFSEGAASSRKSRL